MKNCSSMVSAILTGRRTSSASAVDQRLELDVELGAEAAAEIGRLAPAPGSPASPSSRAISIRTKDGLCDAVWMVTRPSLGLRHRDEGLERRVHHLLRAEGVLEDMVGRGEGRVDVAAPQLVVERDIGVRCALRDASDRGTCRPASAPRGRWRPRSSPRPRRRPQAVPRIRRRSARPPPRRCAGRRRAPPRPARRRSAPCRRRGSAGRERRARNRDRG